jgi:membrane protein
MIREFAGLLRAAWVEYERDHARYLAVAMVYYAIVSLVPLFLLLLAALGLLLRYSAVAADVQHQVLLGIEAGFGPDLQATITRLLDTLQRESITATAIGLGGLLFGASVLFRHLRLSFRAIWKYDPPLVAGPALAILRTTLLERFISFAMVLGGGLLLMAALVLIAATQWLDAVLAYLPVNGWLAGWLLAATSSLVLAALTFGLMLKFLPPVPLRWRHVWLATLLCALAWVFASELLTLYGTFVGNNRSASSALGGLLAIMLWMNIVSQVLFFGAELSKVVAQAASGATPSRADRPPSNAASSPTTAGSTRITA